MMIAKGYISSRSFMGERVPQSVQNLVIRDYCKSNHLIFELSSTEYAMNESYYVLRQLLQNSGIFYKDDVLILNKDARNSVINVKTKVSKHTLICIWFMKSLVNNMVI